VTVYYNENDPFAVKWLRELMADSLIPEGVIDDRSIKDVRATDLDGFRQCHFFAGIGGWVYALQLAGWPTNREVWTGSCPCQPFSQAGKRLGTADQRHLWPVWRELIRERKPATCFGEQVGGKDGRAWLAGVRADLEPMGYAVGAADLPAAGVGAPHLRQRLWWVADAEHISRRSRKAPKDRKEIIDSGGINHGLANSNSERLNWKRVRIRERGSRQAISETTGSGKNHWSDSILVERQDGKVCRIPTEPALFPLAHGIPNRVGMLRGAGNAIVPQVAAEFVASYLEAT